jgi:hypothetical protein
MYGKEKSADALEKHRKYKDQYMKNCVYWGLGIENEVYLELSQPYFIMKLDILEKQTRERYSLNYYNNYKTEIFTSACREYVKNIPLDIISIPCLLNSHSFTKTDFQNEPETYYSKDSGKNPLFVGETLFQTLARSNPKFASEFQKKWLFDGDTVEFNTEKFFNVSLSEAMEELATTKENFLRELNNTLVNLEDSCYANQSVSIMKKNHPVAMYMTNLDNVSFFNNGTLHYNLTLPTELNEQGEIKDWWKFVKDHQKAIRAIQWMEPFLIAMYGSPDPLSFREEFSKASQRCAVSRYIGIGTYNTDRMARGKLLTSPVHEHICNKTGHWWYTTYHKTSGYTSLKDVGLDINFNKHYNHGIELRFFDHITDPADISSSFEFIIYLMDFILESDRIQEYGNPILSKLWNDIVIGVMRQGKNYVVEKQAMRLYENVFSGILVSTSATTVSEIYAEIYANLKKKYQFRGMFSKHALFSKTPKISPAQHILPIVGGTPDKKGPCCQIL